MLVYTHSYVSTRIVYYGDVAVKMHPRVRVFMDTCPCIGEYV